MNEKHGVRLEDLAALEMLSVHQQFVDARMRSILAIDDLELTRMLSGWVSEESPVIIKGEHWMILGLSTEAAVTWASRPPRTPVPIYVESSAGYREFYRRTHEIPMEPLGIGPAHRGWRFPWSSGSSPYSSF